MLTAKIKPTRRNILLFALSYQLYPMVLSLLVRLLNPEPKFWGIVGIFAIAEALLGFITLGWKRKARLEVLDEREMLIQLKINSCVSKSVEYSLIAVTIYYTGVSQINGLVIIVIIGLAGALSQFFANYYFRRDDSHETGALDLLLSLNCTMTRV